MTCVLIDQNDIFMIFMLIGDLKKPNFTFYHSLTSDQSDKQCFMKK